MRITNVMSIAMFQTNLQTNTATLNKFSNQVSTNRKIMSIDEDPVGVLSSLTARRQLANTERYNSNVQYAKMWVDTAESVVRDINSTISNIYELADQAANGTNNEVDRQNIANSMNQLVNNIIDMSNSTINDQYIFSGYSTYKAPFARDEATGKVLYNNLDLYPDTKACADDINKEKNQHITMQTSAANDMQVSVNGVELAGDGEKNMFYKLDKLITAVKEGDSKTISSMIGEAQDAQSWSLVSVVNLGSQQTKIKTLASRYSQDIINCTEIKSSIEDVSQGEAIMNLKVSEAIYRQTLSAGARLIMPSLADFLK